MTKNLLIKLTNNCVREALNKFGFCPSKIINEIGWIRNTESGSINFLNFSYIPRGGIKGAYQIEPELIIIFPVVRHIYETLTNKKSNYKLSFRTFSVLLADIECYPNGIITGEKK